MGLFKKKYQVKPNTAGFLYRDNVFERVLPPGYYEISDWKNRTSLFVLPEASKLLTVTNQEVLAKDNVALRFSFNILYKITDGQKFLGKFALDKSDYAVILEAEQRLCNIVQFYIRNKIASLDSESLNEKRGELADFKTPEMVNEGAEFGITVEAAQLRDLTFPKSIQDLFSKTLEAKIRAKSEMENARTAVATARALKNASELMKDDENIKFLKTIEALTKISEKGRHTFVIGDMNPLAKKN
ncbi:MAG: slipin family protein [Spirochaetes bacterium]|nr:slipin family protein [Spirochaetota bacterium]